VVNPNLYKMIYKVKLLTQTTLPWQCFLVDLLHHTSFLPPPSPPFSPAHCWACWRYLQGTEAHRAMQGSGVIGVEEPASGSYNGCGKHTDHTLSAVPCDPMDLPLANFKAVVYAHWAPPFSAKRAPARNVACKGSEDRYIINGHRELSQDDHCNETVSAG